MSYSTSPSELYILVLQCQWIARDRYNVIFFTSIQSCNTEGQVSPCVPGQEMRQSNIRNTLGDMRDYSHMSAAGSIPTLTVNISTLLS
jgi:hypothetical protein